MRFATGWLGFVRVVALVLLGGMLAAACRAQPARDLPQAPRITGYLGSNGLPDHTVFLPPPPAVDSALGVADLAVFHATRALENGARWQLATHDDAIGQAALLGDFGCALGIDLRAAATPALAHLLARAGADLFPIIGASKDYYDRPRPFVGEQGPVCVTTSPQFAASGSYPSGHSAMGWLYALLLAEADPTNAAAIVARGRAFGESRVVCGVHYVSDVEAGRTVSTAVVAALHGAADFTPDMAAVRTELAALRRAGGAPRADAQACSIEQGELKTPW